MADYRNLPAPKNPSTMLRVVPLPRKSGGGKERIMATLVLTAVGTALGGPIGGALGGLIGQSIDQQLFGPGVRRGPRLGDLSVQTSNYGSPIPRIYGTIRVA